MKRKFKLGERVFYKCYDGQIESGIITGIEDSVYQNERNEDIPFKMLHIEKYGVLEDYNVLAKNNEEAAQLKLKYKTADKIIKKIMKMIQPFNKTTIKYIIENIESYEKN